MHRSQLCSILMDCSPDTFEAGVTFWSGALGLKAQPEHQDNPDDPYVVLEGGVNGLTFMLQKVNDTSRIHLDIETDDKEAEVRRLEALGATRVANIEGWVVMRDPADHLFCVVSAFSPDFARKAQVWND